MPDEPISAGGGAGGAFRTLWSPPVPASADAAPAQVSIIQPQPQAPHATILLVEDHPDSRDALRALLEAVGYRVRTAVNGSEAVEQALADPPDLILMDVMMPQMDGFEATRRLRATPGFPDVPIVAVTAMEGAREMSTEAGCSGYISKPVHVPEMLRQIRVWVGRGEGNGGDPASNGGERHPNG